jgi:hypothetical protein
LVVAVETMRLDVFLNIGFLFIAISPTVQASTKIFQGSVSAIWSNGFGFSSFLCFFFHPHFFPPFL